jgi:hypothetical protein
MKRIIPLFLAGFISLSSCVSSAPDIMPARADIFAMHGNSFEAMDDLAAFGITSNQNGIPTESKSAVRINTDVVHSGGRSLEAYGTIGSPAGSTISIDLPVRSLMDKDTWDLSNTILSVSVFIPQGSPIDKVYFAFSKGSRSVIIPVFVAGSSDVKGRWFSNDINIKRFYENESVQPWVRGRDDAKAILRDCDTISLVGHRAARGGTASAGFIVDDLKWADQAKVYGGLAKIAVENKNVAAFIIWMVSDRYPQGAVASGYGDTSLLDAEYMPKPAYYAVLNELKK